MNPYENTEYRNKILEMQLEVNVAAQAAYAAESSGDPSATELRQEWRDLNTELQQYIESLRRK
jgi:hypothetical protein|tara:strand:- start:684 stop:872 length:189 start_codon:yes stop_codon:yes gene_type:complete